LASTYIREIIFSKRGGLRDHGERGGYLEKSDSRAYQGYKGVRKTFFGGN